MVEVSWVAGWKGIKGDEKYFFLWLSAEVAKVQLLVKLNALAAVH